MRTVAKSPAINTHYDDVILVSFKIAKFVLCELSHPSRRPFVTVSVRLNQLC